MAPHLSPAGQGQWLGIWWGEERQEDKATSRVSFYVASVSSVPISDVSLDPGIWNQTDSAVTHLLCDPGHVTPFRDLEQRKSPTFAGYGEGEMNDTSLASVAVHPGLPRMVSVHPGVLM